MADTDKIPPATDEQIAKWRAENAAWWGDSHVEALIARIYQEKARADRLRERLDALYDVVEKDECSVTYCAQGRGGMVHAAWLEERAYRASEGSNG